VRLTLLFVAALFSTAILTAGAGRQEQPLPQPRFTTGVDLVQIDVSVLDRGGNPVRGLTEQDFSLFENGKPQVIRGFVPIELPAPVRPGAAWVRDIGPDVVANRPEMRRLVVILMDDGMTAADAGESELAVRIARAAIDQLGPADLAAVAFTYLGRAQNFTADRRELHAAVDSFAPRSSSAVGPPIACKLARGGCVVAALRNIGEFLNTAPPGRKVLIYVGSSPELPIRPDAEDPISVTTDMFRMLQRANVEINAFDAGGLRTFAPTATDRSVQDAATRTSLARAAQDNLRSLADNTGGRAIVDTNAPDTAVAEVFHRNSAYYLLGFQSSDSKADGRFRKIEVRVNRPDVEVRTRSGYYASRSSDLRKKTTPDPLEATLAHGLPAPDLPVQLHAAILPVPGRREAAVVVTAGLQQTSGVAAEHVSILIAAFDSAWKERGRQRQSFDLAASAANAGSFQYDVHSRFVLRPGRYEIRVAADSGGRRGSVMKSVDVPDFRDHELALSSVFIDRRPAAVVQADATRDLLPIVPTSARTFAGGGKVSMFVRVSQGGKKPAADVTVTTRIVDARDNVRHEQRAVVSADRFAPARTADHQVDLPLAQLEGGDYLLRVDAAAGAHKSSRDARFRVQ
jgi:VWFA-related protein